jgi:hypothetical protein
MKLTLTVLKPSYPNQTVLLKSEMGDEYSGFLTKTDTGTPAVIFGWKAFYGKEVTPLQVSLTAAKEENLLYQIHFLTNAIQTRLSENNIFIKDVNSEKEIPVNLLDGLMDKKIYLLTHDVKAVTYKFHMSFADLMNGKIVTVTRIAPKIPHLPSTGDKPIESIKKHMEEFVLSMNKSYINYNAILRFSGDINAQERADILEICNKNGFKKVVFEAE